MAKVIFEKPVVDIQGDNQSTPNESVSVRKVRQLETANSKLMQ